MKNIKLKLLFVVFILFLYSFFVKLNDSFGLYRKTLNTTVNLSVLDPNASYAITINLNDGTGNTRTEYRGYNQQLGSVTAPTRENYNFIGWYDGTDEFANQISSDYVVTSNVTIYAKWQKIVCKKVPNQDKLHKESCASSGGCQVSNINIPVNSNITYGTIYGPRSPIAGDAYDCDVNNDGIYDAQTQYGKYTERFYFLRIVDNGDDESTGALVYYTGVDSNGPIDSQHNNNIGSTNYNDALNWLPTKTSTNTPWNNPSLIDFDVNNGKISRFLNFDDLSAVCGPISGEKNSSYFAECGKWFLFENSKFQSENFGRAGIWLQSVNTNYYRIQTQTVSVAIPQNGANSENIARPVIEIPISAFEGYKNTEKHTITFNTHGGTPSIETRRIYAGDPIGEIDTITKEHYTFDGWYANYSNDVYSNPVTSSTIVQGDMTLHAKWNLISTNTVTFNANGGTINGDSTFDLVVNTGNAIEDENYPEVIYSDHIFVGWYKDLELSQPFVETEPITEDITLYAAWVTQNHVARINGVGYDTLELAIGAVPTTGVKTTITLLKDITLSEAIEIPNGKWVELDGKNYTISGKVSLINNQGKLNIISGTISTSDTGTTNTLITNAKNATLNISGGNLHNNCFVEGATTEFLVIVNNGGTINISGGSLSSYGQSASINNNSGTLNISGGEIKAHNTEKAQVVYMVGGTVNISGNAYLENVSGGKEKRACVDNNGGTLKITGGTIVSKGWSAVIARKGGGKVIIGINNDIIDISTPVLRGQNYALEKTNEDAVVEIYDGIFEAYNQLEAISATNINKPENIDFTDGTVTVDGITYNATYLLPPSVIINFYEEINGTAIPVEVAIGSSFGNNLPTPNSKEGYFFAGWFIDGDLLKPVTNETVVTGSFTVYAKWVQSVSNATMDTTMDIQINTTAKIEFEEDDIESVTYVSSDTSVATVDVDGTVHAVDTGMATITLTGELSGDTRTVTVNVVHTMSTVKFYDKDYNPNDLEHSTLLYTVAVDLGSSISDNMPESPTNTNYVFNAWYINGNSTTPFTNSTIVNGDIIVVANWKEKVSYATLTTSPDPFEILVGENGQITLTSKIQGEPLEDYTYTSDNTNYATVNSTTGEVTGVGIGDTNIIVTGSLSGATVQVPISVDVLKYTVTFKDGNSVIKTVSIPSGSTVGSLMPPNQTKNDYIFNGWVFKNNNTLTPFTSETVILGDVEVYANWKEKISIAQIPNNPLPVIVGTNKLVSVTASGSGGLVEDYTLSSSNSNYVRVDGKTIYGDSIGSVTLTITGVESHETILITVNVVNSHNVTFDPDNGDTPTEILVGDGLTFTESDVTIPNNPTKTDYVFDNWYLYDEINETLTTTRLDINTTVSSDLIYKAKWVSNNYKVAVYGTTTTYHETLQSAFTAVPTNGNATEVKILQDISNPSGQTKVSSGRNIILNGGNHSVTCGAATTNQMIFNEGGILRIVSGNYYCGKKDLAVFQNAPGKTMYVEGGLIENTNNRGAIYNEGYVEITGGTLISPAPERGVVQNSNASASIKMSGGTVIQTVVSTKGALYNEKSGSSITITGGTVTSVGNAIQIINGTFLTVGTKDDSYDATSPVIQGDLYGISSTTNYKIYDGIIKGKSNNKAVNDFSKINDTETGSNRITESEGEYYTLYYEIPNLKYHINFDAKDGEVVPTYKEFELNNSITSSDLPIPTRENYTFDGWYIDNDLQTPFATFTPNAYENVTYYAKWNFNSSLTPVNHNVLSNAMQEYFTNVSSWVVTDETDPSNEPLETVPPQTRSEATNYNNGHQLFKDSINSVFTTNNCSYCGADNNCNNPQSGNYCDYATGYDTGLTEDLNVYLYENGEKDENIVSYITSTGGKIYNMIPGITYLWESTIDNTKYGVVTATGNRRTLKTSVRNLRDLGGLTASNETVSGTIDYGRLYRGAQITSAEGVNDLNKLGITREIDLRANGEGTQSYKLDNYDTGTKNSYNDIVITNYIVNPIETTYIRTPHLSNYQAVKSAMRSIMEKVVFNHDSIFFHCTIGTDRTGTMAYFLEGLLGVSEEDRLRDYEMTYFFGLTNRTRFHDSVGWSDINPRFYAMYRSYPTNADIYSYFMKEAHEPNPNDPNDLTDQELLRRFRLELIH